MNTVNEGVEIIKDVASDVKEAATEFYNEHKETFDTIGKVVLTVSSVALVVVGTIAIAAAVPAGLAVSAAVAIGAGIVVTGAGFGVVGGISNTMTGGSFLNGFCGGFVNGSITAAGAILGHPFLGNLIGGFVGNTITENFNNMDIEDLSQQKSQSDIFYTSLFMGGIQALIGKILPIASLSNGAGLKGIAAYIAKFFGKDLDFMLSNIGYMLVDGLLRTLGGKKIEMTDEQKRLVELCNE